MYHHQTLTKNWGITALALSLSLVTMAQRPGGPGAPTGQAPAGAPAADGGRPAMQAPKPGPKPYKEVITEKASTKKGLFTIHKVEDKWFFEIHFLTSRKIKTPAKSIYTELCNFRTLA